MGLKELNDLDSNGLNDVSQPKKKNEFDLADSSEVAEKLEQDKLTADPETKRTPRGRDADTSHEKEKIPDSLEGNGVLGSKETQKPKAEMDALPENLESDNLHSKLDNWIYAPDSKTYEKHKDVFDNPKYYNQETGEINWPPNNGFIDEQKIETLPQGTRVDRYGSDYGSFVAPYGTEYEKRSLPPGTENSQYSVFEVIKPINVQAGETAPWFDEPGGGTQYKLPLSVDDLIDDGYLRRID